MRNNEGLTVHIYQQIDENLEMSNVFVGEKTTGEPVRSAFSRRFLKGILWTDHRKIPDSFYTFKLLVNTVRLSALGCFYTYLNDLTLVS